MCAQVKEDGVARDELRTLCMGLRWSGIKPKDTTKQQLSFQCPVDGSWICQQEVNVNCLNTSNIPASSSAVSCFPESLLSHHLCGYSENFSDSPYLSVVKIYSFVFPHQHPLSSGNLTMSSREHFPSP